LGLLACPRLRQPAPPAPARGLFDRYQRRRLPDAVALRVAGAGGPDARYGAAGDPLDPVPHASDRDRDDRAASPDRESPFPVRKLWVGGAGGVAGGVPVLILGTRREGDQ